MNEQKIPRETAPDSTIALLRDPYHFISKRCRAHGVDLFEARVQLKKTICMTGRGAAELFYDRDRFMRDGAAPGRLKKTLFGEGGVQGFDGEPHRHRKGLFMSIVSPERVSELASLSARYWEKAARKWESMEQVTLYDEAREILTRSVCEWAGVPLEESEVAKRTEQLTALYEYAGAVGPKHWKGRRARKKADRWAGRLVEELRAGKRDAPPESALRVIAEFRDHDGEQLEPYVAGVELLNVLRPTVAVAVYIVFVAHALHRFPACREKLASGQHGYADLFVEEVRRFYPFFPAVIARVRREFEWKGYKFPEGRTVLLDLYGTNHDAREWENPEEFRPERFADKLACPYSFVPQGGADAATNHRCPGEGVATELMKVAADFLANRLSYGVPDQDLSVDGSILPALPRSRFVMKQARLKPTV